MKKKNIIISTIKSWNIENAEKFAKANKKRCCVRIITRKEDLIYEKIREIKPDYIFFPHWSWIIPENIWKNFHCVVFHMTDLPFGRGGSPLQNLISRKIYKTKISAIKVSEGMDTGDIYMKKPFDVSKGNAHEILTRLSNVIFQKMIPYFLSHKMTAKKQKGDVTIFRRKKPEESNLADQSFSNLSDYYDFIRMLDGEGYPKAFIGIGDYKIIFSNVSKNENNSLKGIFEVKKDE